METLLTMQLFPITKKTSCKAANLCDGKRGCLQPFINYRLYMDTIWILLLLNFNYETKYKSF